MKISKKGIVFTIVAAVAAGILFMGLLGVTMTNSGIKTRNDSTMFYYRHKAYDLLEINPNITGIMQETQAGNSIVIECHMNPQNNVYIIYNTETMEFDKTIIGTSLTWMGDDIQTGVYAHGDKICRYNGYVVGQASICPPVDYIDSLSVEDDGDIIVKVVSPIAGIERYEVFYKRPNGYEKAGLGENSFDYRKSKVQINGQQI